MTRLTGRRKSLLLAMLGTVIFAQAPIPGYTEELPTQSKQVLIPELELIKEEETVSIASRYEQPISQAAANVYSIILTTRRKLASGTDSEPRTQNSAKPSTQNSKLGKSVNSALSTQHSALPGA
jgi:hypothetical protein